MTGSDLFEELHLDSSQCNLLLIGLMLETFLELNPLLLEVIIASQVQRGITGLIRVQCLILSKNHKFFCEKTKGNPG